MGGGEIYDEKFRAYKVNPTSLTKAVATGVGAGVGQ